MGDNTELPPEPGTVEDHELGIPGPPAELPKGDMHDDDPTDLDHEAYDDADDPDELDGEKDPDEREDGLEEPEDDSEDAS